MRLRYVAFLMLHRYCWSLVQQRAAEQSSGYPIACRCRCYKKTVSIAQVPPASTLFLVLPCSMLNSRMLAEKNDKDQSAEDPFADEVTSLVTVKSEKKTVRGWDHFTITSRTHALPLLTPPRLSSRVLLPHWPIDPSACD